jgi:hypothetical protein
MMKRVFVNIFLILLTAIYVYPQDTDLKREVTLYNPYILHCLISERRAPFQ